MNQDIIMNLNEDGQECRVLVIFGTSLAVWCLFNYTWLREQCSAGIIPWIAFLLKAIGLFRILLGLIAIWPLPEVIYYQSCLPITTSLTIKVKSESYHRFYTTSWITMYKLIFLKETNHFKMEERNFNYTLIKKGLWRLET